MIIGDAEDWKGRLTFNLKDLKDVTIQITTKGKLGIFYPEGISPEKCLKQVEPFITRADGGPAQILNIIKEPISKGRVTGKHVTLEHRRQLSLGLEAILAEDWYLYRYQEPSRERARWKDKIEREGIRLKEFAIEHLRSGYPETYDKMKRWRKLKEGAKEALLKEGNPVDVAEGVINFVSFVDRFPIVSEECQELLDQRIKAYQDLASDIRIIILEIEAGKRLKGACRLCTTK